jgi:hypothetical protein
MTFLTPAPLRPAIPKLKLLRPMEDAAIDCWVGDITPAVQSLITSIRHALPDADVAERSKRGFDECFYSACRKLEAAGLYQGQSAKAGIRLDLNVPAGNAMHWLNLSPVSIAAATFATVASAYLATTDGDGVPESQRARFRTATRRLLGLPEQCADEVIIAAAERLPIAEVIELPNRVMDLAQAANQSRQSAKNLRTAVRAAMRYAAQQRACPIVFRSAPIVADVWVAVMNTHFPLASSGPTSHSVRALRKGVKLLATTAVAAHEQKYIDHLVTPDSITRKDGDAIIRFIRTRLGREYDARQVRRALNALAALNLGKLGENQRLASFQVDTALGARPAIYLRDQDGNAASSDWSKMLTLLVATGLPSETVEFLRWYGQWVTLPPDAFLETDCEWPPVLNRHLLSRSSLDRRSNDVRAWIGCAMQICRLEPGSLTPSRLFGELFEQIGKAVIAWWRARQAALRAEDRKHGAATKGSLHHIIVSAGILAYAGYVQARHRRGFQAERIDTEDGGRIDVIAETIADKTAEEARFLGGYGSSLGLAGTLKRLVSAKGKRGRKSVKDETGANRPEFKDIRKIVQYTPPAWWIELLDSMHCRIRKAVSENHDHGRDFHVLVQHAWELGLFISTGLRGEEACRLELDVHLKPGEGRISLAAGERKNVKAQSADLQARYVPADIHDLYLNHTLPWLCRAQHEESAASNERRGGSRSHVRAEAARARMLDHRFLIVDTNGRAPGVLQATDDPQQVTDTAMDDEADRRFKQAVARHGDRWRAAMMRRAIEAGLTLPDRVEYSFGRHCIRGAFGYAIFQRLGEVAAANYLGDSTDTVQLAYAAVEGINVNVSLVAGFVVPNRGITLNDAGDKPREDALAGTTVAACPRASADRNRNGGDAQSLERYLEKEAELRADLRAGVLSRDEYDGLLAQHKRLYLGEARMQLAS